MQTEGGPAGPLIQSEAQAPANNHLQGALADSFVLNLKNLTLGEIKKNI